METSLNAEISTKNKVLGKEIFRRGKLENRPPWSWIKIMFFSRFTNFVNIMQILSQVYRGYANFH